MFIWILADGAKWLLEMSLMSLITRTATRMIQPMSRLTYRPKLPRVDKPGGLPLLLKIFNVTQSFHGDGTSSIATPSSLLLPRRTRHTELPRSRVLAKMHHAHITALASSFVNTADIHIILRVFSWLQDLCLTEFKAETLSDDMPNHHLWSYAMWGAKSNLFFTRALQLSGETVQDLTLGYCHY
jgi:hypothetical protein